MTQQLLTPEPAIFFQAGEHGYLDYPILAK